MNEEYNANYYDVAKEEVNYIMHGVYSDINEFVEIHFHGHYKFTDFETFLKDFDDSLSFSVCPNTVFKQSWGKDNDISKQRIKDNSSSITNALSGLDKKDVNVLFSSIKNKDYFSAEKIILQGVAADVVHQYVNSHINELQKIFDERFDKQVNRESIQKTDQIELSGV